MYKKFAQYLFTFPNDLFQLDRSGLILKKINLDVANNTIKSYMPLPTGLRGTK